MAVALVLSGTKDVPLIHWAARIAEGRRQPLIIVWAIQRRGDTKRVSSVDDHEIPEELTEICEKLDRGVFRLAHSELIEPEAREDEPEPQIPLTVISITAENVDGEVEREVESIGVDCLILPRYVGEKSGKLQTHMLANVECEIVLMTCGDRPVGSCREIVSPVGDGPHSASCLRMAYDVASVSDARLVTVHVEPDVDEVSPLAARRMLSRTVARILPTAADDVEMRVAMSRDVVAGITECVTDSTDLVILGMKRHGIVRRFSSQGVAERLVNAQAGPSIAVVQSAMPFSSKFIHWLDDVLRGNVPQLPREQRVALVERIQESSRWDFDFILLICLSTLIAAGGLIQNSAAVVIGAMLVAPLMTPLLGTGLSLVQGNVVLFQSTLLTVLRAFVVAFLISWIVALLASPEVTAEMMARGSPRVLDIAVAMVGGMAAAYASGRPNLLSALPGVAIAASLVPPIATSGIAAWTGDVRLALGSALLFFTNIVAIVVGTAVAFRAVGIRSGHAHGSVSRWTVLVSSLLLVTIVLLAVYESLPGAHQTPEFEQKLQTFASDHQADVEAVTRRTIENRPGIQVQVRAIHPLSQKALSQMRQIVFEELPRIEMVEIDVRLGTTFRK